MLEIAFEKVSEFPSDAKQLHEIIESVEAATSSLAARKTSEMILIKDNLTTLKQSLSEIKSDKSESLVAEATTKVEESKSSEPEPEEQKAQKKEEQKTSEVIETKQETTVDEKLQESKLPATPVEESKPQIVTAEVVLDKSAQKLKHEIENTMASIKKARRPPPEVQAVEKVLEIAFEKVSELPSDAKQLHKIIESVEAATSSLAARKTSEMILIKDNLTILQKSLSTLKSDESIITEDSKLNDKNETKSEKLIKEILDVKPNSKDLDDSHVLSDSLQCQYTVNIKQEIEEILVLIRKSRRTSAEIQDLSTILTRVLENIKELENNQQFYEKVFSSVLSAKTSLLSKRTMELILLRDKVSSLEQSLTLFKPVISAEKGARDLDITKVVVTMDKMVSKETSENKQVNESAENKQATDEKATEKLSEIKEDSEAVPEKPIRKKKTFDEGKILTQISVEAELSKTEVEVSNVSDTSERKQTKSIQIPSEKLEEDVEKVLSPIYENIESIKPVEEPKKPLRRRMVEEKSRLGPEDRSSSQDSIKSAEPRRRDSRRIPTFIARLKNRSAPENSIIKLTCAVSEPECSVCWSKDGILLKNSEKYLIESANGVLSLEIKNATSLDAANYSCVVTNNNGEVETSAILTIFSEDVQQPTSTFTKNLKGEWSFLNSVIRR